MRTYLLLVYLTKLVCSLKSKNKLKICLPCIKRKGEKLYNYESTDSNSKQMRCGMKIKYHQGDIKALFVHLKMCRFRCSVYCLNCLSARKIFAALLHIIVLDIEAYSLNVIVK